MIQILLVDDHPSVMEGTRVLLEQEGDMKVTFAKSAHEVLEMVVCHSFDVMLFDFHIADVNGIELAKQVLKINVDAVILIYTGYEMTSHFNLMIESGIVGFISKTNNREQLAAAIRCALRGEVILPYALVKQLRKVPLSGMEIDAKQATSMISKKEHEMLTEIAKGKSNKEIAEIVLMSQRSVEYSLTNLFQKLNVKSRIEAAMKAKRLGILKESDFNNSV